MALNGEHTSAKAQHLLIQSLEPNPISSLTALHHSNI